MKYLICSLLLLAVLVLGCWLTAARVAALTDQIVQTLDSAYHAALRGDMAAASQAVESAHARWQDHQGFWGCFLRHAETDDLAYSFESLRCYAQLANTEETLSRIVELQAMLHHLADMELPHYYNFL